MDPAITRIAMWSGPRNLSTAMMRSWENRPDTSVMDEPLYAAYLDETGLDHPMRDEILAAGPVDVDDAIAACLEAPADSTISYQKHMAHHLLPGTDRSWIGGFRNVLLLRDPRRVLASYAKVRAEVTLEDIGVPQQLELAEYCEFVVDSDDFLTDPAAHQREICRRLDVPCGDALLESMLNWPPGRRPSDGVWAPAWYDAVEASTGFGPAPTTPPPVLPDHLAEVGDQALAIYELLRADRITVA
ncbi:MAG: HAD family hydrolase [Ilumatobacter sp.]|uniref:sulfotransferase-like domain-containing protein n=1 Tax=Ilumatobacter sp. TaxID=1967498 RepID=UPI0032991A63